MLRTLVTKIISPVITPGFKYLGKLIFTMTEILEPKITKMKIGYDLMADITVHPGNHVYHGIADYVKRHHSNAGYLLNWEKGDKQNHLYTVTIFENMPEGFIFFKAKQTEAAVTKATKRLKELNNHADIIEFFPGYDNDDLVKDIITIRLKFRFIKNIYDRN